VYEIDENDAGKPRLGDCHRIEVQIKESKAIKVNSFIFSDFE